MDAHTLTAAQGTSTAANTTKEQTPVSRELIGQIQAKLAGLSLEKIEQQCRELVQTTARAAIELGIRLLFLKEVTVHGDFMIALQRIGIGERSAQKTMAIAIRFLTVPEYERLIDAAQSKSKLFELLILDDYELECLTHGEAVRGVSLTTLPKTSVAVLRSNLKANDPYKDRAEELRLAKEQAGKELAEKDKRAATAKIDGDDSFNAPVFVNRITPADTAGTTGTAPNPGNSESTTNSPFGLHPDSPEWGGADSKSASTHHITDNPAWGEAESKVALTQHITDFPAVYTLMPGDYNGWPVSLIRHAGKTWLMASEVSAILAKDGAELEEIQAILYEWHRLGKPADASLEIRLASTAMVVLVIDKLAVDMLDILLNTPASAALAAWCADFDTLPALAEVKALHEAPADLSPNDALEGLEQEYSLAHSMLHNLVAQLRGVHELSELSSGNQTKFSIHDIASMLDITCNQAEGFELLFDSMDSGIHKIRCSLRRSASLPA